MQMLSAFLNPPQEANKQKGYISKQSWIVIQKLQYFQGFLKNLASLKVKLKWYSFTFPKSYLLLLFNYCVYKDFYKLMFNAGKDESIINFSKKISKELFHNMNRKCSKQAYYLDIQLTILEE